ncbi:hypothetical protein J7E78_02430 [Paenibacillus polymyxa]|uniref:hypothetical protein n=1 Tax=Paenibacillus polymyxa TaxID=1406 RepID=UPI001BECCA3C|nr:hypothetical protein [Paenibacillus polymyxa]MBT2282410.1 hypothetical protein [Paenibacillus polymyxa]
MDIGITRVEKNIFSQLLFKVLALAVKNNAEFVRSLDESIIENDFSDIILNLLD